MPRAQAGYENQTAATGEAPRRREHIQQPVFDSPEHKARYTEALRVTPRYAGEDVCAWLDRVTAAVAGAPVQARLPYREPGEEG